MNNEKSNVPNQEDESVQVLLKKKEQLQKNLNLYVFNIGGWFASVIVGIALLLSYSWLLFFKNIELELSEQLIKQTPYIIIGGVLGALTYGYGVGLMRFNTSRELREIELKLLKLGSEELKENIEMNFFTKLVQINFKYLDQYYLQTQEQANKSFRLASSAAIVGLIIIIVGITMMYFSITESAYVTTAVGVVSELIATVFFYLYNRTILKMSEYHKNLVVTQNISLALKISEGMEGQTKHEAQKMLIDRLTIGSNKNIKN